MPDSECSEKYGVVQIHISLRPIAKCLPCVQDKGYVDAQFFLTFAESKQRFGIINQRLQYVLGPNKIESLNQISTVL
jgi:hypothetical protein